MQYTRTLVWHPSMRGDLTARHAGLSIRINPITDASGRASLHVVSHDMKCSAGWILASVDIAKDRAQQIVDRMEDHHG